jgi:hypothetical protein
MKMMSLVLRIAAGLLLAVPFAMGARADTGQLSPLRVLFVGYDPKNAQLNENERFWNNPAQLLALKRARSGSFEHLLRRYFMTVKVVYGPAYTQSLSVDYDVTIFDALPPAIKPEVMEQDPKTRETVRYEPPHYLTDGFDRAAILIGEVAAQISEPLNYKMDWKCLCLEAHAHDMNLSHPIFNTPYKVTPTLVKRATPQTYRKYFYSGRALGDTMLMWRVQKQSPSDGKGFPAGLVSSGPGFVDAKDAEVISGGECSKGRESVSIARHGNFFMWGFSGDPEYMTDEAQIVFVNAIHYIARFQGQHPYSHRPFRSLTREVALDTAYRQQAETYDAWVKSQDTQDEVQNRYLRQLQKAGRKLPPEVLKKLDEPKPAPKDRDYWLKEEVLSWYPDSVVTVLGSDIQKYLPYYESNLEYLRPESKTNTFGIYKRYAFEVDEDVRSLAVSNRSVALLDLCVAMLESNTEADKAERILTRYTGENFHSAAEWRRWLDAHRINLYFSDVDGFRFHSTPSGAGQVGSFQ